MTLGKASELSAGPCSPTSWASTGRLGSVIRASSLSASSQGTTYVPCWFRTCRGPAPHLRPQAPGLAARWPAFTKPGPMPVPEAARTKTQDGIQDWLWAQLLFLEARPRGDYNDSLCGRDSVLQPAAVAHPCPSV